MTRERDEESGKYRTSYSDENFLEAIRTADTQPSTPEVAAALGCANRTALVRLHELADEGKVERRKVGAVNLWSLTPEECV
jgi:Mn-dependent DtxR family transcriptional regulator